MNLYKRIFACTIFALTATGVFAQTESLLVAPEVIEQPTIKSNSQVLKGQIVVSVTVDEKGKATSANATSGPGGVCDITRTDVVELRKIAEAAAMRTTFKPGSLNGNAAVGQTHVYFTLEPFNDPIANDDDESGIREYSASTKFGEGNTVSLPRPAYPPAARAVRASGAVVVQVLVDIDGTVFSSEAISGHPLLRSSAAKAACSAKFGPTLLSGKPVKVLGTVTYNFIP